MPPDTRPALPALILAAGRGERMRPLTDRTPKPLLTVGGRPLIEWHLEALARAGVRRVVINTAWLEDQFPAALGDGRRFGLDIRYSTEGRDHGGALETAGGMAKALPLLGPAFWVVAGDVFAPDFRFDPADSERFLAGNDWAHLWFVDNPAHHPDGDFALHDGRVRLQGQPRLTYATIGLFRAEMVRHLPAGQKTALRPVLEPAIAQDRVGGERYAGRWTDVGTPERLAGLNATTAAGKPVVG
jgi:MurNAc alpha-1-phosphate uridylyltransferase